MDLHPRRRVEAFLDEHYRTLGAFRGFLEEAVPKAYAKWEEEFPDANKLPGDSLCNAVRTKLRHIVESAPHEDMDPFTLDWVPCGSTSRQLLAPDGTSVRIRRHPWNHRKGRRTLVVPPPIDTLFGTDYSLVGYELAVLWIPDQKSKSLRSAVLAAVADLGNSPTIFHRENLPDFASLNRTSTSIEQPAHELDDFEDFWPTEKFGDSDPA